MNHFESIYPRNNNVKCHSQSFCVITSVKVIRSSRNSRVIHLFMFSSRAGAVGNYACELRTYACGSRQCGDCHDSRDERARRRQRICDDDSVLCGKRKWQRGEHECAPSVREKPLWTAARYAEYYEEFRESRQCIEDVPDLPGAHPITGFCFFLFLIL